MKAIQINEAKLRHIQENSQRVSGNFFREVHFPIVVKSNWRRKKWIELAEM